MMNLLEPLAIIYDTGGGTDIPLPEELVSLYGHLEFPLQQSRPYVISNFVTTLDGVVTLGIPGREGAGEISGFEPHDLMVMGILRAAADAVIISASSLRVARDHLWTAENIYPPLAQAYQELRSKMGKSEPPLHVVVTTGEIDVRHRVFRSGEVPVLIVTTIRGARQIQKREFSPSVRIAAMKKTGFLSAEEIVKAVGRACQHPCTLILVEGGPHLMGYFMARPCVDELFMTLAPQIAGRDAQGKRPGLVAGMRFAPEHPRWGMLLSVKRGGSHLFLRYRFESADSPIRV